MKKIIEAANLLKDYCNNNYACNNCVFNSQFGCSLACVVNDWEVPRLNSYIITYNDNHTEIIDALNINGAMEEANQAVKELAHMGISFVKSIQLIEPEEVKEHSPVLSWSTRIKNLMASTNFTRQELADRVGVTPSCISHWCTGRYIPKVENIEKIVELEAKNNG